MLFGRPIRFRATRPPIFLLLLPTFSLMHSIGFYLLPPLVCCFVDTGVLSINSWCLTLSKMFERRHCQIGAHYPWQLLVEFWISIRCFSRWTWRHLCLFCCHRLLSLPTCWSSRLQRAKASFVLLQWARGRLYPSSTMQTTKDLWLGWELLKVRWEWERVIDTDHIF